MQKLLLIAGIVLLAAALLWPLLQKSGLGRLPGDIAVEGDNFRFYFPVVTCLVVSLLVSAVLWFFNR